MIPEAVKTTDIREANLCNNWNGIFVVMAIARQKALFSWGAKHTIAINVNERYLHISLGEWAPNNWQQ